MRRNYVYELLFIILVIMALFTGLSLFSHSPSDSSYSNIVFTRYDEAAANLFGKAGAYTADFLGTAFGWSALFFPFGFVYLLVQTVKVYRNRASGGRLAAVSAAVFLLIVTSSVLSGLVGGEDLYFADKPNGGILGVAGAVVVQSMLGRVGGILLCAVLLIFCLMVIMRMSFTALAQGIARKVRELKAGRRRREVKSEKPAVAEKKAEKKFFSPAGLRLFWQKLKQRVQEYAFAGRALKKSGEKEEIFPGAPDERESDLTRSDAPPEEYQRQTPEFAGKTDAPPLIVPPFRPGLVKPPSEDVCALGGRDLPSLREQFGLPEGEELLTVSKLEEMLNRRELFPPEEGEGEADGTLPAVEEYTRKLPPANHIKNVVTGEDYRLPFDLLDLPADDGMEADPEELQRKAELLLNKLRDFGVDGRIREIRPGPVVTLFELEPAPGIKINKIANLENDLALAMSAISIRIIAPIPGKAAVGIEVPNAERAMVSMRELVDTEEFKRSSSPLAVAMGKDISGRPYFTDLRKMPHLLVAGTTGSGKSVCVNTIICSILYKSSPQAVKFIMIDPKMVELSVYEGIPHLMAPVVTDPRKASVVLQNVVREMESRYSLLASCRVRHIDSYNSQAADHPDWQEMPYMVVIVDEFADLMMVAGKEVENAIIRIAQMARAVGIHLVLATQRPSVNVITGIIKANMPARVSFKVSSKIDSRTILDRNGAELLLGKGDCLFIPPGSSDPIRIHGCFVSEQEVLRVVDALKEYGQPEYNMTLLEDGSAAEGDFDEEDMDARYEEALQIVKEKGFASISMIQRYLRIGYNRAARIVETMERQGLIAPSDGTSKPREFLHK